MAKLEKRQQQLKRGDTSTQQSEVRWTKTYSSYIVLPTPLKSRLASQATSYG